MAYPCSRCDKRFSTPYNRSRHEAQRHHADDESQEEEPMNEDIKSVENEAEHEEESDVEQEDERPESEDETTDVETDDEDKEDRECWHFLFNEIREKEPDFLLDSEKLKRDLLAAGVSEEWANERKERLYFKLLSEELREQLLDLVLNMRILHKDSIFEQLMDTVRNSDLPFAEAFRDAWKKQKSTVIEEVLRPVFPENSEEESSEGPTILAHAVLPPGAAY